jgi:uncharacterized membrane protein YfcA
MSFADGIQIPYMVSGLGVGFIVGLSGVGGGALMTPVLVLWFGIHPASAVGTDLIYASITKGFGTLVHGLGRAIDWRIVGLLAGGSLPATLATTAVLHGYGAQDAHLAAVITRVLAYALIVTALGLVFRRALMRLVQRGPVRMGPVQRSAVTVGFGAALGVLVTVSSVGAGSLGVTVLVLLYPQLPVVRIIGTDIAHAVPLTLIAGLGHMSLGTVDAVVLVSLLAGSIPGVIAGSLLSPRVPDAALRYILATVLTAVAILLLSK